MRGLGGWLTDVFVAILVIAALESVHRLTLAANRVADVVAVFAA